VGFKSSDIVDHTSGQHWLVDRSDRHWIMRC